jgi:NAD(P)-dependent dehydrogenase (short-subunit alcohol dehydrogenase family)
VSEQQSPFRLDGKTALVTGAGSGIGEQIAHIFAHQGARVFIGEINREAGERVAHEIIQSGGQADFVPLDVSDPASVDAAFAQIDANSGPPDVLVNNAGIGFVGDILQTTLADFERLHSVNTRGVFLCSQAAVRRMKETGRGGSIVNVASIASKVALSERFAYSATKGAVLMMTRALACDYVRDNIRCNCVCPARVHTGLVDAYLAKNYAGREAEKFAELSAAQPMGRMARPDEIAHLVLYLASDEAAFVTGAAYDIDGGTLAMR